MRVTSPGDGPRECWSEGLSVLRQAVDHCDGWRSAFPAPHSMPSGLEDHVTCRQAQVPLARLIGLWPCQVPNLPMSLPSVSRPGACPPRPCRGKTGSTWVPPSLEGHQEGPGRAPKKPFLAPAILCLLSTRRACSKRGQPQAPALRTPRPCCRSAVSPTWARERLCADRRAVGEVCTHEVPTSPPNKAQ